MAEGEKEADSNATTILTTEHFALQGARTGTISDSSSRASIYLATLSGMLLALSLLGNATSLGTPFVIASLVLAPTLAFIGEVTFVRVLNSSMEDTLYARGINRIRHYYLEVSPELRAYFVLSDRDDMTGVLTSMGVKGGNNFGLMLTTAGMIGVINSVVIGSLGGGVVALLRLPLTVIFIFAVAVFFGSAYLHLRYQINAWERFTEEHPPLFPTGD